VELRVARDGPVAPDAALEVGATQRRGVGRGHAEVLPAAPDRGVGERDGRPERVEVDDVVVVLVHVGVDVPVVDLAVEAVPLEVPSGEGDRILVDVAGGHVVAGVGGPDRPDAACGHRIEVRPTVVGDGPEHPYRDVTVQLLDRVVEDARTRALARAVALLGHLDGQAALADLHGVGFDGSPEKRLARTPTFCPTAYKPGV
jgi:hypothetical protein